MEQSLHNYDDFKAENFFRDRGNLIGAGECGGKAKGIAYAACAIQDTPLGGVIGFPDLTVVLSTEVFDDFIENSRLSDLYDDGDWARVRGTPSERAALCPRQIRRHRFPAVRGALQLKAGGLRGACLRRQVQNMLLSKPRHQR